MQRGLPKSRIPVHWRHQFTRSRNVFIVQRETDKAALGPIIRDWALFFAIKMILFNHEFAKSKIY